MKHLLKITGAILLISLCLTSCEDDDDEQQLEIKNVEAGVHDGTSTTIARGGTIAVEFDAIASDNARLDFYHIEIHDHPESGKIADEYKIIDDDFKDISTFKGMRNAHVHQHIQVPDTANLGSYHVVVIIADEDGYTVDTEALETHITVTE